MVLELVGSRVLAPYVGTSIVVWTSLIGIILGSLSIGYWQGGRISDRDPSFKALSAVIGTASLFIGIIPFAQLPIQEYLQEQVKNVFINAPLATIVLFAAPSMLLGMVSPYAVRLKMVTLADSGKTVGTLYAISTVGSIVGTFLAGYFLIAYLGTNKILLVLSLTLILTSILADYRALWLVKLGLLFLLIAGLFSLHSHEAKMRQAGFIDTDTHYSRVRVFDKEDPVTGRPVRVMMTNPKETQSAMYLDRDDNLVFRYLRFFRLAAHFKADIKSALMIGSAGCSFPKDFLGRFAAARMDVVEIDEGMTELAIRYFNLRDDRRLSIIHEDGRTYLNRTEKRYDVIYSDAFNSFYSLPYQLTTVEAVRRMDGALNDDGMVMVNLISAIEGEEGKFLRALYRTFQSVFPQVYIFPVSDPHDGSEAQNIILIALKTKKTFTFQSRDPELDTYLMHLWDGRIIKDMPLLTDDYTPTDRYILEILKRL
jgi:spermidine synthase